jgi:hypothetical protein
VAVTVLDWARRRRPDGADTVETVVEELRRATPAHAVATRGLPLATVLGVDSFYDFLRHPSALRVCTGTACRFADGFMAP